jgi:hypothetical protein
VASPRANAAPAPRPCPSTAPEAAAPSFASVDDVAREVVARMNGKDSLGVFAMFNGALRAEIPLGLTTEVVEGTIASKGRVSDITKIDGDARDARYALRAEKGDWRLSLHVDDAMRIRGMRISEPPPPGPPVAETPPIALPFRGKWFVAWGGANAEDNPHLVAHEQRRAADLVVHAADGKSFKNDGKKNEDYLVYGQEVLAAADGTVITVVDGVPENVPGEMNALFVYGNMVTIDHGKGLFSVYAHLQPGKIKVKSGQKVKAGAAIALAGNSGNSSEPHLHFQVQDGARLESAWGVEPVFANVSVTRDGKTEKATRYTFKRGDVLEVGR